MTKQEKLNQLDGLVLDRMIALVESEETHLLPELVPAVNYLKANNKVEVLKQEDDAVALRKKKLEEAKKRREAKSHS